MSTPKTLASAWEEYAATLPQVTPNEDRAILLNAFLSGSLATMKVALTTSKPEEVLPALAAFGKDSP